MIRFEMRNISDTGKSILLEQDRALKVIEDTSKKFEEYRGSNKSVIVRKVDNYLKDLVKFDKTVIHNSDTNTANYKDKLIYEYLKNKEIILYRDDCDRVKAKEIDIETRFVPSEYGVLESFIKIFEENNFNILTIEEYGKIYEVIHLNDKYYIFKNNIDTKERLNTFYDVLKFIVNSLGFVNK